LLQQFHFGPEPGLPGFPAGVEGDPVAAVLVVIGTQRQGEQKATSLAYAHAVANVMDRRRASTDNAPQIGDGAEVLFYDFHFLRVNIKLYSFLV
tara:strand:+ start:14251 stop:14532 length:282 start_codon:yes stop_codon:yes gene_type:complete